MNSGQEMCQYLEWDSTFFGYKIARLIEHRLTLPLLDAVGQWCTTQGIDCLYFLAESDDSQSIQLAENKGFHLVDIRMTYTIAFTPNAPLAQVKTPETCIVRKHCPEDLPALKEIARASHHASRFYFDGHFPVERCHQLYEIWIEKSCAGEADVVWVAEYQQHPVGYISCHNDQQGHGQIGLVGVDASARGQGIGASLVYQAVYWFVTHGCQQVDVITQGRNLSGQRLYQKCGFLTKSVQLFYHKWFS